MIKKSSRLILQQIKQAKSKKKKTVTSVFHKGIKTLMKTLGKTEPYFVRCINPNKQKSSTEWTESIVEHQLRCGGLLEALKVLKLGYPTRVPYNTLYEKWHDSVDNPLIKNMDEVAFGTSLLLAFDVNENDYETGLTKIFFKPAKAAILDTIMAKAGEPLTAEQNARITEYLVGKRIRQLLGAVRTHAKFRMDIRKKRAAEMWQWGGRIASILGATVVKQLHITREEILKRKRNEGAIAMQSMFRGFVERKEFTQKIGKIKDAVKTVTTAYGAMQTKKVYTVALEQYFLEREAERARKRAEELAKMEEDQKRQEEAEAAEREAEELRAKAAAAAAATAATVAATPRLQPSLSPEESKRFALEEEQKLEAEIEAKRQKQKRARSRLKQMQTKQRLEVEDARRMRRMNTISNHLSNRQSADAEVAAKLAEERVKDMVDSGSDFSTSEEEKSDSGSESSSDESDFDFDAVLKNFESIARLGAKFSRHTGKKIKRKPQLRTVKVSFSEYGTPQTLSWGAGSRAIKMKDIWYISWGHKTPNLLARKDRLDAAKCFSIVGHSEKQVLDLEAYTKREAKIWVKGLRKLKNLTDKRADELAEMNMSRLMEYATKKDEEKKQLRTKQLKVVQLQQDLFVMTVEAVYKELEEQKIWSIDQSVKEKFNATTMYETVLKQDIAWRKWQWFVRDQITNYLREHDMVKSPRASHNHRREGDDFKTPSGEPDEVTMFLEHYKLQKYDTKLRESGLNNLKDLTELDEASVVQISIEVSMTVLHKKHFIEACRDLKNGKYPPEHIRKAMEVDQFLEALELTQYSVKLKKLGLRELMTIQALSEKEVADLARDSGMKTLHKKKFIGACKEYKSAMKGHRRQESIQRVQKEKKDQCLMM